jgi:hypothetical protein
MQNARISPARAQRIALIAAAATVAGHLVANPHYGFFRDELYFIVCGRHPAFGYVDQPPLVPLAAALSQVFGTSLFLLRAIPALCAGVAVWASCLLAAELGGGAFALVLTAICVALAPVLAAFGATLSTDTDMLWSWPLAALFALRAVRRNDGRWWLGAGATLGIAAESKYSVLFFAFALLVGLLLTQQRRWFASKWFWYGAALGVAIALPSFVWQALHQFPMLELLRNGQHGKNVVLTPPQFLLQEVLITSPLLAPIWIIGLVMLLRRDGARWLGYAFIVLIATMIALHGKHYYPAAIYSILFAAGSVAIDEWTVRTAALRPAIAAVAVAGGALILPFVVPIFPEQTYVAYAGALRVQPAATEHLRTAELSQEFADMHGWEELAAAVARVYDGLPAAHGRVTVVASNYGEAAAIDVFGPRLGLPHAVSGHNQYFLWGPGDGDGRYVIDVNGDVGTDRRFCAQAWVATTVSARYAMPYERALPIVVCRGLRPSLAEIWPRQKVYI